MVDFLAIVFVVIIVLGSLYMLLKKGKGTCASCSCTSCNYKINKDKECLIKNNKGNCL